MGHEPGEDAGFSKGPLRGLAQYRRKYPFTLVKRQERGARVLVVHPKSVPDDNNEITSDELQEKAKRVTRFEEWEVVDTVTGEPIGSVFRTDMGPGVTVTGARGETATVGPNAGPYFADENTLSGNRRAGPLAISGPTVWLAAEQMWKWSRPVKSILWSGISGAVHFVDWIVAAFKLGLIVFGIVLAVLSASTVWEVRHQLADRIESWLGVAPLELRELESNSD